MAPSEPVGLQRGPQRLDARILFKRRRSQVAGIVARRRPCEERGGDRQSRRRTASSQKDGETVGKHRGGFPGGDAEREVPRHSGAHHAERLWQCVVQIFAIDRDDCPAQTAAPSASSPSASANVLPVAFETSSPMGRRSRSIASATASTLRSLSDPMRPRHSPAAKQRRATVSSRPARGRFLLQWLNEQPPHPLVLPAKSFSWNATTQSEPGTMTACTSFSKNISGCWRPRQFC